MSQLSDGTVTGHFNNKLFTSKIGHFEEFSKRQISKVSHSRSVSFSKSLFSSVSFSGCLIFGVSHFGSVSFSKMRHQNVSFSGCLIFGVSHFGSVSFSKCLIFGVSHFRKCPTLSFFRKIYFTYYVLLISTLKSFIRN